MILIGWSIALVCNSLVTAGIGGSYEATEPWGTCGAKVTSAVVQPLIVFISVVFPLALEGSIYLCIFTTILLRKFVAGKNLVAPSHAATSQPGSQQRQKRLKVARMLFCSNIWYMACFLPAPMTSGLNPQLYNMAPLMQLYFRSLLAVGYATVPVIYLVMNNDYRNGLYEIWRSSKGMRCYKFMGCKKAAIRAPTENR
ncbi:uncharacterized protein LOC129589803 [Paramacrobiotus metropolitanus]|uniref:uncharacterized protein LOC129589803 n=1 Tax=Paramacrobiotus metropolitanus TaxID=2943436 RepID=UPI00244617D3|nr:uncharacterized protein LOC129589803 [Paramacrobiotus metropolitanus]XP_055340656.1 uncharacterized protein LOC129589803 [Paramacrobiotus metropolitanus]